MHRLVLATRNAHKAREFSRLLAPAGIRVELLSASTELPPELGGTFAANALPKARVAAEASGRAAIGDDSGIEAAALGGRPGVRSARFAGESATDAENLAKLIDEVPAGSELRYVCAVAYVDPRAGVEHVLEADCLGTLSLPARGVRGFGYDPVFLPAERRDGRTMAELADAEKDAISHRGRAARALAAWLDGR